MVIRVLVAFLLLVAPASAFDPAYEGQNFLKINERAAHDYTPEQNAELLQQGLVNESDAQSIYAADGPDRQYGRNFTANLCGHPMNGCAGDIRLYHWGERGYGIVKPILFTQRNGSTLSGHVWMTAAGPKRRPGVVITNGSVQAPETLYWFAAQTLAKAGYVVMTWDPQGQGLSDTFGEGEDRSDGFPSQEGRPFYDGTEDALDFFFSSPGTPYAPRPSCTSGTSHVDKQQARVADGRASAFNPFFASVDRRRVGLVGHSLGASAVSYVGQLDPRVKAIVAYDNLRDVTKPDDIACASGSSPRPATQAITKPALGLSADYSLVPTPYTQDPGPSDKSIASLSATAAGVDTGEIVIRGGTHFEFSYIPNAAFTASLRGMDLASWYTTAWLDHELKGDPTALARLRTTRWRSDARTLAVDSTTPPDANMYSRYFLSRLDLDGFACEDLRTGCDGQIADDGRPPDYSFLAAASTPDSVTTPGSTTQPAGAHGVPPAATGPEALAAIAAAGCKPSVAITRVRRRRVAGRARARCERTITRVAVSVGKGKFRRASGTDRWRRRVRLPRRGRVVVRVRVTDSAGQRVTRRRVRSGCAASGRCRRGP